MDRSLPLPEPKHPTCGRADENLLVSHLDHVDRQQIVAASEHVLLPARTLLYEQGARIRYVYFFLAGIASAPVVMHDGRSAEVFSVGRDGFLGVPLVLNEDVSLYRCWMQVPGSACRLEVNEFRRLFCESAALQEILRRYTAVRLFESTQLSACNVLHTVEQRLCRWLMLASYRMGAEQLPVTHELLADNLGAQRTTVSLVAGNLERAGLIAYKRGQVRVLNRSGLETAACECLRAIRNCYASLLQPQ